MPDQPFQHITAIAYRSAANEGLLIQPVIEQHGFPFRNGTCGADAHGPAGANGKRSGFFFHGEAAEVGQAAVTGTDDEWNSIQEGYLGTIRKGAAMMRAYGLR